MSQHALSDQQVNNELSKMTEFIKQEAMEKAREIEIKANEEFEIEKSKLVRQETDAIDSQYEKKFKQATMSQQITRSTVANKTRLKVLGARQELLDNIFEEAQKKLAEGAKDKGKYQKALKGLLLEGFYALDEPELQVRARKKDYDVVKKAIEEAAKEFKKELGKDITAKIQEDDPLPEGIAGGVVIISGSGKIDIDNTFEARLRLLEESAAPAVREALFGKNPNLPSESPHAFILYA
ncbi:v-type proton ATPase subunit E [Fusarium subglutinans]|uniref:V-type proton ATPase subunit E n=1 Tax=Gibberella subglutinans TaxID=42677 RepID=A0A8H5QEE9_GIBSU|nr:v-type proton ATPase subunit E [Fusarium subglutinans]KAF5612982.1 v-type proton ATPase subunit E [Fusarium subglutinans]